VYIRCFSREITIHTVIYGVYIRFWPTLTVRNVRTTLSAPLRVCIRSSVCERLGVCGWHGLSAQHTSCYRCVREACASGIGMRKKLEAWYSTQCGCTCACTTFLKDICLNHANEARECEKVFICKTQAVPAASLPYIKKVRFLELL